MGATCVVNGSGTVVESLDYYPYGGQRIDAKSGGYGGEKRKYDGTEYDSVSGLNYMMARYQSPTRGQFLSEDPVFLSTQQNLSDPQSLNSYSYANDNPIIKSDPNGRLAVEAAVGALVGVGVGIALQGAQDFVNGRVSGLDAYASQAAGGFVAGAIIGATDGLSLVAGVSGGVVAGAAGGATKSVAQQSINSAGGPLTIDASAVRSEAVIGGEFGLIPGLRGLRGFNGQGSLNSVTRMLGTKLEQGTIQNLSGKSTAKLFGVSALTQVPGSVMQSGFNLYTGSSQAIPMSGGYVASTPIPMSGGYIPTPAMVKTISVQK